MFSDIKAHLNFTGLAPASEAAKTETALLSYQTHYRTPGRVAVTAVGEIEYLDVFGDRHLTQFRFRCNGQGYPLGMFKADGEGNEANWYWIGVLGIGQRSLDQRAIQGFR